jgi:putative peptidoglycan lipid II flippase
MVKRITNFLGKEISSLHQAAYVLAFFTLFAQVLGFFRGRLLSGEFGASLELDVYFASFRIPDMMFIIVTAIVSVGILVPYIISVGERSSKDSKDLVSSIFTLFLISSSILLTILIVFMPNILGLFFPKFIASEFSSEFIAMSRIMCISPFILGLSSFVGSIIQTKRKFMIYALSPVFYNLGSLSGILYLYPKFGLIGLSLGVIVGSLLHLFILLPSFLKSNLVPKIKFNFYSYRRLHVESKDLKKQY